MRLEESGLFFQRATLFEGLKVNRTRWRQISEPETMAAQIS
jgi:hypothetical protein